jgi:excinuclease ABC subunit B
MPEVLLLYDTVMTMPSNRMVTQVGKPGERAGVFSLHSDYEPAGDQPKAISELVAGVESGKREQALLGVTGSGKTFTVANVIQQTQMPTLVIAHNKTLAAQLAQEFRAFFPNNAVHYFVSYYDYYQPEAYKPTTDTYIEKEAMINEEIDRLRHASTQALLTRKDVIIVASVSCIYGLGSPKEYEETNLRIERGAKIVRNDLLRRFVDMHYERTNADLKPGQFRAVGQYVEVMPVSERYIVRAHFEGDRIVTISLIDAVSRSIIEADVEYFFLFPAKHFVSGTEATKRAAVTIQKELDDRLKELEKEGKVLEHERLKRRTKYDLAMIKEVGYCNGIENYSRHFSDKKPGEAPDTLLSYFPHNKDGSPAFLTVIDESHVTVSQVGGMYAGDRSRKDTLVEHGFRLPSCRDNRPLKFEEFDATIGQRIYVSATPGKLERERCGDPVEMIVRPTGLVDPIIDVKPVSAKGNYGGQVADFIEEVAKAVKKDGRALATTLTKKMAEDLTEFLKEKGLRAEYLHSEIKTIERIEIITRFRKGEFDVLIGVNLLREGLDMPEVTLIGILDADKEGFLRSETALIQTIGRAARNVDGRVILYADSMTNSLEKAIGETDRRRAKQIEYNTKHGITPMTIKKTIMDIVDQVRSEHSATVSRELSVELGKKPSVAGMKKLLKQKEKQMNAAAKLLDFETAAILRDEIKEIERMLTE